MMTILTTEKIRNDLGDETMADGAEKIDWNQEPTVAECTDQLLDAMRRNSISKRDMEYWERKLREALGNESRRQTING